MARFNIPGGGFVGFRKAKIPVPLKKGIRPFRVESYEFEDEYSDEISRRRSSNILEEDLIPDRAKSTVKSRKLGRARKTSKRQKTKTDSETDQSEVEPGISTKEKSDISREKKMSETSEEKLGISTDERSSISSEESMPSEEETAAEYFSTEELGISSSDETKDSKEKDVFSHEKVRDTLREKERKISTKRTTSEEELEVSNEEISGEEILEPSSVEGHKGLPQEQLSVSSMEGIIADDEESEISAGEETEVSDGEETEISDGEDTKISDEEETEISAEEEAEISAGERTEISAGERTEISDEEETEISDEGEISDEEETEISDEEEAEISDEEETEISDGEESIASKKEEVTSKERIGISSKEKAEIHKSKRPKISSKELSAVSDDTFEVSEEQSEISGEGVSYTSSEISGKEQLTDTASEEMLDISDEEKAIVDEENADISSESEISEMEGEISEERKEYEEKRKRSTVIDIPETEPPTVYFRRSKHMVYRKKDRGFGKFCQCLSPCIARLLYSKRTEYRAVKAMLGFPIGCLFGYILYKLVIERLELGPFTSWILGCILAMFLGVGYAFSTQVRCMCFLAIPSFFGKTGRAYVSTYVITFVITGPVSNLLYNAGESMRVLSCIASLNLNHTMERFKLMFVPVKEIVWDFVGAGKKIQDDTKEINSAYKTIEDEVRDENELKEAVAETKQLDEETEQESRVDVVKRKFSGAKDKFGNKAEKLYGMKSELRCEGIFTKGVKGCYNSFEYAYDKCHHHLPVIGYLLCWPMKLTFICDIGGYFMKKRTCDSDVVMNPGFGESVETAEGVQREFDKDFGVSMQYKIDIPPESVNQITAEDMSGAAEYQFEKRRKAFQVFMNIINRILAFMFLLVFHVSRKYCDHYLRVIQFDNKYVTSYFRHIDARRHKVGKLTLLPLKKGEKLELFNPFTVKYSAEEKGFFILSTVRLLGELMTISVILLFDWTFYEFLMLIQRHAHVSYKQTGVHHIKMTVFGDGFVGNMVRSILKGFDKKHTTDQVTSTAECLPLPRKLERRAVIELYLIFLLMFILMGIEAYALRLRRVICAFFYPKREKKRILYLYNDRMKKRRAFLQHMRARVRKAAREQAIAIDSGVLFSLRHLYPKYFGWLGKLGLGKKKCLVCEEVESRKIPFIMCSDECPFCYCPECWTDIKRKCFVCLPDDDEDSAITEDDLSDFE